MAGPLSTVQERLPKKQVPRARVAKDTSSKKISRRIQDFRLFAGDHPRKYWAYGPGPKKEIPVKCLSRPQEASVKAYLMFIDRTLKGHSWKGLAMSLLSSRSKAASASLDLHSHRQPGNTARIEVDLLSAGKRKSHLETGTAT